MRGLLENPRFEVFPAAGLRLQTSCLPAGATVTVTCSPRKGLEATMAAAEALSAEGFRVVPHIAARSVEGRTHMAEIASRLAEHGVEEVFVIGGDDKSPRGPYSSAAELLIAWSDLGQTMPQVGIAGYPEPHPFVDGDDLMAAIVLKESFARRIVTQICLMPGQSPGM